jgi:hypothetical protein
MIGESNKRRLPVVKRQGSQTVKIKRDKGHVY